MIFKLVFKDEEYTAKWSARGERIRKTAKRVWSQPSCRAVSEKSGSRLDGRCSWELLTCLTSFFFTSNISFYRNTENGWEKGHIENAGRDEEKEELGGSVMRTLLVQVREGRDVDYTGAVDTARNAFQIVIKGGMHGITRQLRVGHEERKQSSVSTTLWQGKCWGVDDTSVICGEIGFGVMVVIGDDPKCFIFSLLPGMF